MGGAGTGACPTYELRNGVRVCLHSKPKYDRVIAATGSAFYAKPINGVLSHLSTSADTHSRYGACDFEGDGYTKDVLYTAARHFRDELFLAYPRLWTGNWHIHVADAACPNMAAALAAQFELFGHGYNALVGNGPDPLGRYKQAEIMAAYRFRPAPPKPATPVVTSVKVKSYNFPYTYRPAWYPYPGAQGKSYYGPSTSGSPWYSGKTAGGTKTGATASGGLSLAWIRGHIGRIQRCVGTTADGRYGAYTVSAVKRWQKAHGLTPDGIVGPKTWAAMAKTHGQ
jgi:hypothetical protein